LELEAPEEQRLVLAEQMVAIPGLIRLQPHNQLPILPVHQQMVDLERLLLSLVAPEERSQIALEMCCIKVELAESEIAQSLFLILQAVEEDLLLILQQMDTVVVQQLLL
jgi:hypothetical protein